MKFAYMHFGPETAPLALPLPSTTVGKREKKNRARKKVVKADYGHQRLSNPVGVLSNIPTNFPRNFVGE